MRGKGMRVAGSGALIDLWETSRSEVVPIGITRVHATR
jgi:hypothetical protein